MLGQVAELSMKDRNQALRIAVRTIAFGSWPQASFNDMLILGEAAVREALEAGELDDANIMCFNMATNLADCWGDPYIREKKHFELGLAYADKALQLRKQLGKPADKHAMAHWARGKHLLSLGRRGEALSAMAASREAWGIHAASSVGFKDDHEDILGADAWLGFAQWAAGSTEGKVRYQAALDRIKKLSSSDPRKKDAAEIYIEQLMVAEKQLNQSTR